MRTQTSISTSFLRGRDESEGRAARARRKHTQRDGMHKQGVASRTLQKSEYLGSCFGALFPTKRSGDIPTVELHSINRRTGCTHGSTGEYERDEPFAGVDVHMHGRARLQVDSIVLQPEPWVMTYSPPIRGKRE